MADSGNVWTCGKSLAAINLPWLGMVNIINTHKDGDDLGMVTMAARVNPTLQSPAFVPLFLHDHSNIHGTMPYLLHPMAWSHSAIDIHRYPQIMVLVPAPEVCHLSLAPPNSRPRKHRALRATSHFRSQPGPKRRLWHSLPWCHPRGRRHHPWQVAAFSKGNLAAFSKSFGLRNTYLKYTIYNII